MPVSIDTKLDKLWLANVRILEESLRSWFAFLYKQIQLDINNKIVKDVTSSLTDWEYIEEQGKNILKPATLEIMQSGGDEAYKTFKLQGSFDVLNPNSVIAANKHTAKLIKDVTAVTKKGVRGYIARGVKEGKSMPKIGKELRSIVGLTSTQASSVANYRGFLEDKEKFPKLTSSDVNRKVDKYASRTKRKRVQTIARTETARAQNMGYVQGMDDLGVTQVQFKISPAEACPICIGLDGEIYDINVAAGIIPVHPNSFAKDTEIYTENGFINVSKIKVNDKCLSLNPKTFDLEYVSVINKVKHKQDKMIHFYSNNFDLLVTPEHEMFAKKRIKGKPEKEKWEFIQAKDIIEETKFYRSSEWRGIKNKKIIVNSVYYDTALFAEFMAWWLSEGSLSRGKIQVAQSRTKNKDKYDRIVEVVSLLSTNGKIWCSDYNVIFKNDSLHDYLTQFGHSHKKYIPDEIKKLSKEYIRLFLNTYAAGDGHIRKAGLYKGYKFRADITYATSSKKIADGLGELLIKVGRRPSYYLQKAKGKPVKFRTGTYSANHDIWIVRECYAQTSGCYKTTGIKIKAVSYNDIVHCVELKKYHTLLVRRNGKVSWCGNCRCVMLPVIDSIPVCSGRAGEIAKATCILPGDLASEQAKDLVSRWENAKSRSNKWVLKDKLRKLGYDTSGNKLGGIKPPIIAPPVITPPVPTALPQGIQDLITKWKNANSRSSKWVAQNKLKKLGYDVRTGTYKPTGLLLPKPKPKVTPTATKPARGKPGAGAKYETAEDYRKALLDFAESKKTPEITRKIAALNDELNVKHKKWSDLYEQRQKLIKSPSSDAKTKELSRLWKLQKEASDARYEISGEIAKLRKTQKVAVKDMRKLLNEKDNLSGTLSIQYTSKKIQAVADDMLSWIPKKNISGRDIGRIKSLSVRTTTHIQGEGISYAGSYNNVFNEITMGVKRGADGVFSHEFGHHLGYKIDGAMRKQNSFFRSRTAGEKIVNLPGFGRTIKGKTDKFRKYDMYAGRIYNDGRTPEVISVGLENIWKNPLKAAKADPEWFNMCMSAIKNIPYVVE